MVVDVDTRDLKRSAFVLGVTGAFLVIAAIPTDSRAAAAAGLILAAIAHLLFFWAAFRGRSR